MIVSQQTVTASNEYSTKLNESTKVVMRPAVDIHENVDAITLLADLPGLSDSKLSVKIDDKTLAIEGDIALAMPSDIDSLYAGVRSTRYQRAFTVSSELDTGKINASLRSGWHTAIRHRIQLIRS